MITKTVIMAIIYALPLTLLSIGLISSPLLVILLYIIAGLGMAGIGMGIMHDANHGSYTKNNFVNYFLSHSIDFMGCSSHIWKLQHNVLHHTYTNIHQHDEDIDAPAFLLRFSAHHKYFKIQRFQHYYAWFFYGILTMNWVTLKDFQKALDYYKKGLITSKKELTVRMLKTLLIKLVYFTYSLFLPLYFSPVSVAWIIIGFLCMHFVAGLLLSVVFQLAHVVPEMKFPTPDEDNQIESNWHVHQLETTSNFSPKSKLLFWYFGGLTNQIEHHLFPNICHVHYKKLSKIVADTAKEFNVPYHVNKTMFSAVAGHFKLLKTLSRRNVASMA